MPRTDDPFNPERFDFGPPRPLSPRQGVPKDALFGYYELERSERFATEQATDLHQEGDPNDPGYFLGATYHSSLVMEALHHGTLMTGILALTAATHMADLNPRWHKLQAEIDAAMLSALEQLPLRDKQPDDSTTIEIPFGQA